jgi:hypothetical protein
MLPPGFGWSAGDIIKLIEVSVKIYAAFQDANKNSSKQTRILVDEFTRFHKFLLLLKDLLEKYGKPLPFGYDEFRETLRECESFIKPYADSLLDRGKGFKKAWKTIAFTWNDKDVDRLRKQVTGHVQSLNLIINYLTL